MTRTSQWPVPPDSIRYVIPHPVIRSLSRHPLTRDLYPLAFGHYRRAAGHHMHREHHGDDLLIHCTEGETYLSVEDEPCLVRAGDLVLIPALLIAGFMISAQYFHFKVNNPWPKRIPSLLLLLLCLFIAASYYR